MATDSKNLADLYDLPVLDWKQIERRLDQGVTQAPGTGGPDRHTCWLATIDPDGAPHVTGIGGLWVAAFVWRLKQRPLLPPNDPRLAATLAHGHH